MKNSKERKFKRQRGMSRKERRLMQKRKEERRRFLKYGGAALLGLITVSYLGWRYLDGQVPEEIKDSGNVNDTKDGLETIKKELKRGTRNVEESGQIVVDLTTAFLSSQLKAKLPDLSDQFDLGLIRSRFQIVGEQEYISISEECDRPPVTENNPGRYIDRHDKIYLVPKKVWRLTTTPEDFTDTLFRISLHEGIHSTPPFVEFAEPREFPHIEGKFDFTHGAKAGIRTESTDSFGNYCDLVGFADLEEILTEDTTARLLSLLNPTVQMDANYTQGVLNYSRHILPLLGNNPNTGLSFQQRSDPFGFFQAVGKGYGETDPEWQMAVGANVFDKYVQS